MAVLDERFRRRTRKREQIGVVVTAVVLVTQATVAAVWLGEARPGDQAPAPAQLKVHELADDFPAGYEVSETDGVTVTQAYLDGLEAPMSGALFVPAECGGSAQPTQQYPLGSTIQGLRGRAGDRLITVAEMESPTAMPVEPVPDQCAAVTFVKPGYVCGFSSRVEAPAVRNALQTLGIRVSATLTGANAQPTDTVQYVYSALLDDRHVVTVTIIGTPTPGQPADIDPAPARDLLVVAAEALAH